MKRPASTVTLTQTNQVSGDADDLGDIFPEGTRPEVKRWVCALLGLDVKTDRNSTISEPLAAR